MRSTTATSPPTTRCRTPRRRRDQDFLTLTATPLALSHAIIAVGSYNTVSTTVSAYLNVAKDGSNLAEVNREAPNTAG